MSEFTKRNLKTKNITLVLTHQCNLRCTYCYEKHKDNKVMPLETAKRIVDYELTAKDGTTEVEIDLFGGEPLLEFDTIKSLIEYVRQNKYPKDYVFFITTNGVLLNDERKAWLKANTDLLQIGLSLDGTREMHNLNRGNCFDKIDLQFFKETYPEQLVKMTISDKTLTTMAEGVIFCHEIGFKVSCNLAYGINWSSKKNVKTYEEQLMKLIEYYLNHPETEPCALLDINRIKSMSYIENTNTRYCGAGFAMRAYDYDGTAYPCQHFLPLAVGEEKAKASLTLDFGDYVLDSDNYNTQCQNCVIRNVCPTCYGDNYASSGNIHQRNMDMCKMFKIQFKALAFYASLLFKNGMLKTYTDADVAAILKSALIIDKDLKL